MPRDASKYQYVSLAIEKDSLLYRELARDATISGLSLSHVILMWLSDHVRNRVTVEVSTDDKQRYTSADNTNKVNVSAHGEDQRSLPSPEIPGHKTTTAKNDVQPHKELEIEEYTPARAKKLALNALSIIDDFS